MRVARGRRAQRCAIGCAQIAFGLMTLAAMSRAAGPGPTSAAAPAAQASGASTKTKPAKPVKPVDINSASRAELKTLPGIGDVEADRIISGRPYHSKADLAERGVIPTGVFLSLKGRIIANQEATGKVGMP